MSVIRSTDARRTETPNAVMTTYASPTQGGTGLALWRVEMSAARSGPRHTMDTEQVWTFLTGTAVVDLDGEELALAAGDTLVLPAGLPRVMRSEDGFTAVVAAPAPSMAVNLDTGDRVAPPWIV
ncbi:cupin domain-containing protein [Kitasatospora purpeofusca]|uniref:cupin domain-containing protein n=1 Tax=Kitasatospora purpeofusca TaxID=67352 RepID=UPI002250FFE9|nr:cupin domain-containing protein [Kitasatospora purpeofusca]MCX4752580.1 cupin domain-containing protein [Kitasatospora purpeofusca]WSR32148.1 cupin domain-containing protein [Kitasatospora purpeofusca]